MKRSKTEKKTIQNFNQLIETPFSGNTNAICWKRNLTGDFSEIVKKIETDENIVEVTREMLLGLELSEEGSLARKTIFEDLKLLTNYGASPIVNLIQFYERDAVFPFFPTDVYSFHVDRATIPTETILCTYYGEASEMVANDQAIQKIQIPEIRAELKQLHSKEDGDFELFLTENFFDLHYQATPDAEIINLECGNLWKLAVDHPESKVLPCIHRAPKEKPNEPRLLLIC